MCVCLLLPPSDLIDVSYIAASYPVPETTFQSLLAKPTVELVQSLLVQIKARAREYNNLNSEKIKVDVKLEAALLDVIETSSRQLPRIETLAALAQRVSR